MEAKYLRTLRILQNKFILKVFTLCVISFLVSSCSFLRNFPSSVGNSSRSTTVSYSKKSFSFVDQAGEFYLQNESGLQKHENRVVTRRQLLPENRDASKPLERSIVISSPGRLGDIRILRPYHSQYSVWFDGERYFTEMVLDTERQGLKINMRSPEPEWQGSRFEKFPDGNGVYCFYSQVIECAVVTGFIDKAISVQDGRMAFHIIWEGYPYIQEQYPGIPKQVFTSATLDYDGLSNQGKHRFVLGFAGQSIFFHLDDDRTVDRIFWVAQGLSITPI